MKKQRVEAMEIVRKINDDVAVAGQIDLEQLHQLSQEGYRSILNLRSPHERGFLKDEQETAEQLGLLYLNVPVNLKDLTPQLAQCALQAIVQVPKPLLLHCDNGVRSASFALMYVVIQQGADLDAAFAQTHKFGLVNSAAKTHRDRRDTLIHV